MIDRNHALLITRQAELVGISRGNVYDLARGASEADQRLMKRIDELHLAHPFMGTCLREGITLEHLRELAMALSDVQAAEELNEARAVLWCLRAPADFPLRGCAQGGCGHVDEAPERRLSR